MVSRAVFLEGPMREKLRQNQKTQPFLNGFNILLPAPPVLTGKRYEIWTVKMRAQLRAYDL